MWVRLPGATIQVGWLGQGAVHTTCAVTLKPHAANGGLRQWLCVADRDACGDAQISQLLCTCCDSVALCCCLYRFSYKGLGEPLCFWSFGPLATTAFYLACSASAASSTTSIAAATAPATGAAGGGGLSTLLAGVSDLVLLLSTVVGITTTVILFCSHWHQIQGDIAAGKMSPLVRLGTARACKVRKSARD